MGRSPRAQAWQHLGRKGLPGQKADLGAPTSRTRHAAFVWAGITAQPGSPGRGPPAAPGPRAHALPSAFFRCRVPTPPQSGIPPPSSEAASPPCPLPAGRPRPRARGPQPLPHLHARSPGVNPRVQNSDEHPSAVILRVATEEGGGPGLFLRQEAVEGEGLLGDGGGHGRKLEDEEEANCQVARGQAARGHPGGRGPGRG